MDRNGYNPSIIERVSDCRCFMCGIRSGVKLDRHEVFHGANREKSKRLGLWVTLCHGHHMMLHHESASSDLKLKKIGQEAAMRHYGWTTEEFIKQIGKNYL